MKINKMSTYIAFVCVT